MLRKQSSETDPADWFYLAGERLRAADLIWQTDGVTASGIELLHEAAERFLKGYLIAKGWRLERTHDLGALLKAATVFEPSLAQFVNLAADLTQEFFAQHYPGGDWTNLGLDYGRLRQQLGQLVTAIAAQLPQFFQAAK